MDAIKGVAAGGHFFGSAHTLARYETAFYRPLLSDWSNFENWTDAGSRNATERATGIWKKMLADYVPPPLDPAVREAHRRLRGAAHARAGECRLRRAGLGCAMTDWIANARMYAVTPAVEAAWRELLEHVAARPRRCGCSYLPYPAPQPLEALWARTDLGAVFMCGYPIALKIAAVIPLAAPIPRGRVGPGPRGLPLRPHRAQRLAPTRPWQDTFGGRAGWTVGHSQSGFNAFRHELLAAPQRDAAAGCTAQMSGNLVTARNILDAVREGRLDVGPLDAYWHLLIARHAPELTRRYPRTRLDAAYAQCRRSWPPPARQLQLVQRLRAAFHAAHRHRWFAALGAELLLDGFEAVERAVLSRAAGMGPRGARGRLRRRRPEGSGELCRPAETRPAGDQLVVRRGTGSGVPRRSRSGTPGRRWSAIRRSRIMR